MQDYEQALLVGLLRRLRGLDAGGGVVPIHRRPSLNEQEQVRARPGDGIFRCVHNKSNFVPCVACKRSKRKADENYERYQQRVALALAKTSV